MKRFVTLLLPVLAAAALNSCEDSLPNYLISQGLQQGSLYLSARPIGEVLNDPAGDPNVKKYLSLSQKVLGFASQKLGMDTKGNYKTYADLKRRWVSYVVVAAEQDRMEAHLFQYPFFGGLPYRGYFKFADATAFAQRLRQQKLDVYVRPVPAYSTTGWLPDPLVTSMFASEVDFIDVLFHELVHVQFYVGGEADFNEAFATWFASKATERFLKETDFPESERTQLLADLKESQEADLLQSRWVHITLDRARDFYASRTFRDSKGEARDKLREDFFKRLAEDFKKVPRLEKWSQIEWNNAVLVSLSTYHDRVADIEKYAVEKSLQPEALLLATKNDAAPILAELQRLRGSACSRSFSRSPFAPTGSVAPSECLPEQIPRSEPAAHHPRTP